MIHEEKQILELDRPPRSYNWETKIARSHYQKFLSQLSALPSNSAEPTPAIEEAVKESLLETGANEQSWKSVSVSTDEFLFQISFKMWILMLVVSEPCGPDCIFITIVIRGMKMSIITIGVFKSREAGYEFQLYDY